MLHQQECLCGCGRVGYFQKYASNACRQKAYRNRKRNYIDVKAQSVSSMLIDMFGSAACEPIFEALNQISGDKNTMHVDDALEQIIYLTQSQIRKAKGQRRV